MPARVYLLHFESPGFVSRAFEVLMASSRIDGCLVEPERGCLRFLAPRRLADRLVERIYLEGGLTWCSRHDLKAGDECQDVWPADGPVPSNPGAHLGP